MNIKPIAKVSLGLLIAIFLLCFSWIAYALPANYSSAQYAARIDKQPPSQCVAYAVCNAVEAQMLLQSIEVPDGGFNKQWLYDECKKIDNIPQAGTNIRIALKIAKETGLKAANSDTYYKISSYKCIDNTEIKQALSDNYFVILKTAIQKKNWFDGDNLILSTKSSYNSTHAVFLTGYDDNTQFYDGVNSWGTTWGNNGTFKMAYDYVTPNNVLSAWTFEL